MHWGRFAQQAVSQGSSTAAGSRTPAPGVTLSIEDFILPLSCSVFSTESPVLSFVMPQQTFELTDFLFPSFPSLEESCTTWTKQNKPTNTRWASLFTFLKIWLLFIQSHKGQRILTSWQCCRSGINLCFIQHLPSLLLKAPFTGNEGKQEEQKSKKGGVSWPLEMPLSLH